MKKYFKLVFALVLLALIGCSSVTVKSDFDPEYDFGTFKTYRWASGQELNPDDVLVQSPLILKRVQAAVNDELKAKGMQLVESADFDFVVLAHAGTKERQRVTTTGGGGYYGGWYDPYWGPYGGTTQVSYYEEGTLVIDIVHWDKKELAWRGMGTGVVKDLDDQEETTAFINNWVSKILAEFPPK